MDRVLLDALGLEATSLHLIDRPLSLLLGVSNMQPSDSSFALRKDGRRKT